MKTVNALWAPGSKLLLGIKVTSVLLWFSASAQNISKTMVHDGETRTYRIYIPASYDSAQPVPLVMALHGLGDNANNFQGVGFNQIADTAGFIAVYPNALPDPLLQGTAWNTGIYPGNNYDDAGFLNALLDTVFSQYPIDSNRVYCTGFSLGGFMTYRMACESGERFAAVASVSGCLPAPSIANCYPEVMPVMHIHGTSDQTIPYNFGTIYVVVTNLGADSTTHYWAKHNSCDLPAAHDSLPNTKNDGLTFEKYSYSACNDSAEVILIKANGMQHTWPMSNNDVNATKEIWDFFRRHQKTEPANTSETLILESSGKFAILSNPVANEIFVKTDFDGKFEVLISNLSGKRVYRSEYAVSSFTIPLNFLNQGVYLFTLNNQTATLTRKIVVSR